VQACQPNSAMKIKVSFIRVFVQIAIFLNVLIAPRVDPMPAMNVRRVLVTMQRKKLASVVKVAATHKFAFNVSPSILYPK
jgi:hypothetical protein